MKYFFITFVFLLTSSTVHLVATPIEDRNLSLSKLSDEQQTLYAQLVSAWAPIYYADGITDPQPDLLDSKKTLPLIQKEEDVILDPFFDGDDDWTNNAENLSKMAKDAAGQPAPKFPRRARVFVGIQETHTHYYIHYTKYNLRDADRIHDSEMVMVVVKKSEADPLGTLDFVVTDANEFGKIYAANAVREEKLRKNLTALLKETDKQNAEKLNSSAMEHHKNGRPEFVRDATGAERGLRVFVSRTDHSITKLNMARWQTGFEIGNVYTVAAPGHEGETPLVPSRVSKERHIGYSLISQDRLLGKLYPRRESAADISLEKRKVLMAIRAKMFEGRQIRVAADVIDGKVQTRQDLPSSIIRGPEDKKPEASLFYNWTVKTDFPLALPHLLHQLLEPDVEISNRYIYNTCIEYVEVKE